MLVNGPVLRTDHIVGASGDRSWDFFQVHVLDGVQVLPCMVGRDFGDVPQQGEQLLADVEVGTRRNSRSGAYEVTVTLVRRADLDALIDREPVAGLRAA